MERFRPAFVTLVRKDTAEATKVSGATALKKQKEFGKRGSEEKGGEHGKSGREGRRGVLYIATLSNPTLTVPVATLLHLEGKC